VRLSTTAPPRKPRATAASSCAVGPQLLLLLWVAILCRFLFLPQGTVPTPFDYRITRNVRPPDGHSLCALGPDGQVPASINDSIFRAPRKAPPRASRYPRDRAEKGELSLCVPARCASIRSRAPQGSRNLPAFREPLCTLSPHARVRGPYPMARSAFTSPTSLPRTSDPRARRFCDTIVSRPVEAMIRNRKSPRHPRTDGRTGICRWFRGLREPA